MKVRSKNDGQPLLLGGDRATLPVPTKNPRVPGWLTLAMPSIAEKSGLTLATLEAVVLCLLEVAAARPMPKRLSSTRVMWDKGEEWVRENCDPMSAHPFPPPFDDHAHVRAVRTAARPDVLDRVAAELLRARDKASTAMNDKSVLRGASAIGGDGHALAARVFAAAERAKLLRLKLKIGEGLDASFWFAPSLDRVGCVDVFMLDPKTGGHPEDPDGQHCIGTVDPTTEEITPTANGSKNDLRLAWVEALAAKLF